MNAVCFKSEFLKLSIALVAQINYKNYLDLFTIIINFNILFSYLLYHLNQLYFG